jgi:glycosyltransferase involved in cell wall biosynthesis
VKIFLLTDIPSPYQVEVLNQISQDPDLTLQVAYLRRKDPSRQWNSALINHDFIRLDEGPDQLAAARGFAREADLAVFNYYRHPYAQRLIWDRAELRRPWCFWGERQGLRKPEWAGRLVRCWTLRRLHSSAAPIWGVGQFAVDRYKTEFGMSRKYFNFPYFSDLERFTTRPGSRLPSTSERVFLFSGSLINRKGVDLVARAFLRLVRDGYSARLKIIGDGELRGSLEKILKPVWSRVEFTGFVDWADLPAHYASSDVLCVPSRYDGWGLVVPEGLAAGLPVIGTNRMGAALEFIRSDKNGWLIPAADQDAVFDAMRDAASVSASELTAFGRCAQESVRDHSLQHGAIRFKQYSSDTVANWQK